MGKAARDRDRSAAEVATSATSAAADRMLRMVAGSCAHPECVLREVVAHGGSIDDRTQRPSVLISCTNQSCSAGPSMHDECFTKLQASLVRNLLANRASGFQDTHRSEEERYRLLWTSKWDLVRPMCRCACGQGYLRAHWDSSTACVLRVGDAVPGAAGDTSAADEKRAKHEAALRAKAAKDAEAKAREREAKAREREEARERNQQRKAERERERREGPRPVRGVEGEAGGWSIAGGFADEAGYDMTMAPPPPPPAWLMPAPYAPSSHLPYAMPPAVGPSAGWGGVPPLSSPGGGWPAGGWAATPGFPPAGAPPSAPPGAPPLAAPALPPSAPRVARPASFHLESEAFPSIGPGTADNTPGARCTSACAAAGAGSGSAGGASGGGADADGGGSGGASSAGITGLARKAAALVNVPPGAREPCPICLTEHAADVRLAPCGHLVR